MSAERKPRKETPNLDFSKPIDITIFGSENDPCFGKLHDDTDSACKQCGDSELCAIIKSQYQHLLRGKIEKKQPFIDKEMPDQPLSLDRNAFDKALITYLKKKKGKFVDFKKASIKMGEDFDLMGGEATIEVKQAIKRIKKSKSATKIVFNKLHTKIKLK